jgi:hypothetical protein
MWKAMTSGKREFGQSLGTCDDECICISVCVRNPERSAHPAVNLSQCDDPLIRYAADKQGHVTQIHMFILLN